jgi:putative transposase
MPYNPSIHHRRSIRLKGHDYTQPAAYFVTLCTHEWAHLFGKVVDGAMQLNECGEIVRTEWFQTAVVRPYVVLNLDEFVVMPNHIHGIIWIVGNDNGDDGVDNGSDARDDGSGGDTPRNDGAGSGGAGRRDDGCRDDGAGSGGTGRRDDGRRDDGAGSRGGTVGAQRRCAPTFAPKNATFPPGAAPQSAGRAIRGATPTNVVPGSLGAIIRSFKSAVTRRINIMRNTPGAPVWQRNYYEHIIRTDRALNAIRRYVADNPRRWHLDRKNIHRIGDDPLAQEIWDMLQQDDDRHNSGNAP